MRRLFSSRVFCVPRRLFSVKKYTKTHEYLAIDGKTAVVGISNYAQKALGDIVYCELPKIGAITKGGVFATVESVKATSSCYMPVDAEVTEINETLNSTPNLLNSSPEDQGWICKVNLSDPSQTSELMDDAAYAKHCEEEEKAHH
eukprot:TRINITY_DN11624_c0_g1_i1.p1 TRINITY_DN11624_c0_g1~~TRINITY_DN11624_c0_g1_i1.p1  ORF type:complete len:145 (-),score=44.66 TRINITY_DN11624_c0_g1_i1:264-698(-)